MSFSARSFSDWVVCDHPAQFPINRYVAKAAVVITISTLLGIEILRHMESYLSKFRDKYTPSLIFKRERSESCPLFYLLDDESTS